MIGDLSWWRWKGFFYQHVPGLAEPLQGGWWSKICLRIWTGFVEGFVKVAGILPANQAVWTLKTCPKRPPRDSEDTNTGSTRGSSRGERDFPGTTNKLASSPLWTVQVFLGDAPSLKLTVRTWEWMVGRRSFPFWGPAYFQGRTVSFREGISCLQRKRLAPGSCLKHFALKRLPNGNIIWYKKMESQPIQYDRKWRFGVWRGCSSHFEMHQYLLQTFRL